MTAFRAVLGETWRGSGTRRGPAGPAQAAPGRGAVGAEPHGEGRRTRPPLASPRRTSPETRCPRGRRSARRATGRTVHSVQGPSAKQNIRLYPLP